jgi:hypothetical protein
MKVWPVVIAIVLGFVLFALAMVAVNQSPRPQAAPTGGLRRQ